MSLPLSTCVLFILLMQSINRAQLLNATFVFTLFELAFPAAEFAIDLVPLTSVYASRYINLISHINFYIMIYFNLIFCREFRWLIRYII